MAALVLDREVRDWVFIPLTIFMVLMKLLMQYVHLVRCSDACAAFGALCPLSACQQRASVRVHACRGVRSLLPSSRAPAGQARCAAPLRPLARRRAHNSTP